MNKILPELFFKNPGFFTPCFIKVPADFFNGLSFEDEGDLANADDSYYIEIK